MCIQKPTESLQLEEVMQKADLALYEAKNAGRNIYRIYREIKKKIAIEGAAQSDAQVVIEEPLKGSVDVAKEGENQESVSPSLKATS